MNCPNEEDLLAYLSNKASKEKSNEIETHIDSCVECRMVVVEWAKDNRPESKSGESSISISKQEILQEGNKIGRFVILERIGSGGMGTVYAAYDEQLDRKIALKVLHSCFADQNDSSDSHRLLREARSLAKLSHPNVVGVHEVGSHLGQLYMAMEFVEGLNLGQLLAKNRREWKDNLEILIEAGRGLAAAHDAGIIHRDFKPENVLIDKKDRVRVADFGLAKLEDRHIATEKPAEMNFTQEIRFFPLRTETGAVAGSPAYMSPEQFAGKQVDSRTDQFSFCVVLYEALFGVTPFSGNTFVERKTFVENGQIQPAPEDTDVPYWLHELVIRGLQPNPEDRHNSMNELLEKLSDDPERKAQRRRRRTRRFVAISVLVLVAITTPIAVWYEYSVRRNKLCKGAKEIVATIWNQDAQETVSRAFLGTGVSYAKDTVEKIFKLLDSYTKEWEENYVQACEATHIRGDQSAEVMDLRMGCLRRRMDELGSLIDVFASADSVVVQKSIQASSSLHHVSICADEKALRSPNPPPRTAEDRAKVDSIRKRLTKVEALERTGKYQEAFVLAKELAQEAKLIDYKPVHTEALFWHGKINERLGNYQESESILRNAAHVAGESENAQFAAKAMIELIWVIGYQQERFKEAIVIEPYAEIMVGVAGGDELSTAILYSDLGGIYQRSGKYQRALDYHHKSLKIRNRLLGNEHPDVAGSLMNIGLVYSNQGEFKKSLEYYRKSLAIQEKTLGSGHPGIALTLNNLGNVFTSQSNYKEALEYYGKSLAIREKSLGPDHPDVVLSFLNFGTVFSLTGEYEKSNQYYRKSLAILGKTLGPEHSQIAKVHLNMGGNLFLMAKYNKALDHYHQALRIQEKKFGHEHPDVAAIFDNIGEAHYRLGDFKKSLENYRKARSIWEKALGPENPYVAFSLNGMGSVYLTQGQTKKALGLLQLVERICKKTTCEEEVRGNSLFGLARALVTTKSDKKRAIKLTEQAQDIFKSNPKRFRNELGKVSEWLEKNR